MNNKGQTLVLFLFLLPIIFLIFMALYQYGAAQLEKKRMEDAVKEVVQYGLDYKEDNDVKEQMITMFQKSFPDISKESIEIKIETDEVRMVVKKEYAILFFARPIIRVSYVGRNIDGKVQIIKE